MQQIKPEEYGKSAWASHMTLLVFLFHKKIINMTELQQFQKEHDSEIKAILDQAYKAYIDSQVR